MTLNVQKLGKRCKMAHFVKVRTGHERWTVQWPCVHAGTLRTSQSHAGLVAWPLASMGDRLKRYRGTKGAENRGAFSRVNASIIIILIFKKVKASYTRYRALDSELIPVYRQSAHR